MTLRYRIQKSEVRIKNKNYFPPEFWILAPEFYIFYDCNYIRQTNS